jgi:hypothetical protein
VSEGAVVQTLVAPVDADATDIERSLLVDSMSRLISIEKCIQDLENKGNLWGY